MAEKEQEKQQLTDENHDINEELYFPKVSKLPLAFSVLGIVVLFLVSALFIFTYTHHVTAAKANVQAVKTSASQNEAAEAAAFSQSKEDAANASSVAASESAERSSSRAAYKASTSASKALKASRVKAAKASKAAAKASASRAASSTTTSSTTTTSSATSSTAKSAEVRNLSTQQVEAWVFAHLSVDKTKFTQDDYLYDMSKDDKDQLRIHVAENHDNSQGAAVDSLTAPTVGNFLINAAGQLVEIDRVTAQEVVVDNSYGE